MSIMSGVKDFISGQLGVDISTGAPVSSKRYVFHPMSETQNTSSSRPAPLTAKKKAIVKKRMQKGGPR